MTTMHDQRGWEEHAHEAVVHTHGHFHVTHNYNAKVGGFDHLSSYHEHEHDHAAIKHTHFPHRDFESEHEGEAHMHDHDVPVKKSSPARKRTTRRAAGAQTAEEQSSPAG